MNTIFLSVRVLHILLGATWLGAVVLVSFFLMPSIAEAGPDGGKVMMGMMRRRFDAFIPSIAGTTVLTGFWLYWHFTNGFDPTISGSMGGRIFGTGGVLGLIAAVIGGSIVGRNLKQAVALMKQIPEQTDASARTVLMEQVVQHRQRAATGARIVAFLLLATVTLMALGHYV